jgi:proline-specific peptidase
VYLRTPTQPTVWAAVPFLGLESFPGGRLSVRVSVEGAYIFFDVAGTGWVIDEHGVHPKPVVIGLHGGPGLDGTKHRYQLARLADVAQVIVPDQRGHGRSDLSTPDRWNLATWASDVKGLSDALGIDHPVVYGSSFGGFVAQKYAARYPDHPAGLILASTCARIASGEELIERMRAVGGDEAADVVRRDIEEPSEETTEEWMRICGPLMSVNPKPDPLIAAVTAARSRTLEVNLHWTAHEHDAMDLRPELHNLRCPTLVIVGDQDPLIPVAAAQEIVSAIPDGLARLEVIPNAAHELITDNPEIVYNSIRAFISNLT